jgi:hypothetical protein
MAQPGLNLLNGQSDGHHTAMPSQFISHRLTPKRHNAGRILK